VGSNGETLVADSSTSTGLRYQAPIQQNPVLNSAMQVWQRGTSVAVSGAFALTYAADRWGFFRTGFATGMTVSRQVTGDTTNLPFIQYAQRVQRDSGNTSTGIIYSLQNFESINSIPFAGKTVTYSFYARAGANYSAASSALLYSVNTGTGTDQNLLNGYTGQATPILTTVTLTTTWQRFTATAALSSSATQIGVAFSYTPVGTAGANDYFEVTGVQLEVGSVATPFHTYAATIQGELSACQRYYYRQTAQTVYNNFALGIATTTTAAGIFLVPPVSMRVAPTSVDFSTLSLTDYTNNNAVTALTISGNENGLNAAQLTATSSSLTSGRSQVIRANNSLSGYIGISAEL
jgi:hypothetical protein